MANLSLRPHDLVLALKLTSPARHWATQRELASNLQQSVGETNNSLARLRACRLIEDDRTVARAALFRLLVHGIPHVFPARLGLVAYGQATGPLAEPLLAVGFPDATSWAWPSATSTRTRGFSVTPLCQGAPSAAAEDPHLHALLALVDILRVDEGLPWRVAAVRELRRRLEANPDGP